MFFEILNHLIQSPYATLIIARAVTSETNIPALHLLCG
jgi:hypothetical protein